MSCSTAATVARGWSGPQFLRGGGVAAVTGIESARFRVSPIEQEQRTAAQAPEERELLARLRAGDERAFESLVRTHHGTMVSLAGNYVKTRAVAEEVAQEAWLGVLKGLDRFEGRSSLRTWILKIVVNTAMGRGGRESRSVPFSSIARQGEGGAEPEPSVEPERFRPPGEAFAGHWNAYPGDWSALPEQKLLGRETLDVAKGCIDELPDAQRTVITMRDIAGCSSEEVCDVLEISEGNQRVLLHRARSQVRAALERHLDD
jgi:RNA polymerase sigma-70 factor, ECF subfamily